MKVFISQPRKDKTNEQIKLERNRAVAEVKRIYPDKDIEILDSFFENAPHEAKPLWFLGKSFEVLSNADVAYFIGAWKAYRGCKMEHEACKNYGIPTICE